MKKNKDNELEKDDEILRIQAMEDGPKIVNGRILRPINATSVSWMQRRQIFSEDMDPIWRAAAFIFLHSAPLINIRGVINDRDSFINAVDDWTWSNMTHHHETSGLSDEMSKAFDLYNSASPASQPGEGSGSGN